MPRTEQEKLLKELRAGVAYLAKVSAEFKELEPLLKLVAYHNQADNLRFQAYRKGGLVIVLYNLWNLSRRLQWFCHKLLLKFL